MSANAASRVEVFEVAIPASTSKAAPVETSTPFSPGQLIRAELLFPDGCAGLVGARLLVGHAQAVPTTAGAWLLGNDETLSYPLIGQLDNGAWSVLAYNLDIYAHTLHVRYLVADFQYGAGAASGGPPTRPLPS